MPASLAGRYKRPCNANDDFAGALVGLTVLAHKLLTVRDSDLAWPSVMLAGLGGRICAPRPASDPVGGGYGAATVWPYWFQVREVSLAP